MKILATLTIAALTLLTLNNTVSANRMHTLDDIYADERNAHHSSLIHKQIALKDPKLLKKIHDAQNFSKTDVEKFPGKGHRLGGDKYVNRLLGIDHKEGKRLSKRAKKIAKAAKHHRHHTPEA